MSTQTAIDILHLSDLQFGINHVFGSEAVTKEQINYNSLLERTKIDLEQLIKQDDLNFEFVVVTGDLAEWGRPSEFREASNFLSGLADFLDVSREQFIIVPGNHDISRESCQAYFLECAANEKDPSRPYAAKWNKYKEFYDDFYTGTEVPMLDLEQPFLYREFEDFKIGFACLNSTMAESHKDEDHYGLVGENQIRSLAPHIEKRKTENWLNICAVHHNVERGETEDNENLQDASVIKNIVGDSLDLLLHGHTHYGVQSWWNPHLPILSTGSSAVAQKARPEDVPNQYQVLRLLPIGIQIIARAYTLSKKQWIEDSLVGTGGRRLVEFDWKNVSLFSNTKSDVNSENVQDASDVDERSDLFSELIYDALQCDIPPAVDVWVGRNEEILQLDAVEKGVVVVTGIGGQGKSSLISKYLDKWKAENPEAFWDWRDCKEEGDRFHTQLTSLIHRYTNGKFGGIELKELSTEQLARFLFNQLGEKKALLIFDNLDHYVNVDTQNFSLGPDLLVKEALNVNHNTKIIFTCRPSITYAHPRFLEVPLKGLSFEQTLELFKYRKFDVSKPNSLDMIHAFHKYTEGHPLWLNLIATQVSAIPDNAPKIVEELKKGKSDTRAQFMLKSIWSGLNNRQKMILRYMAEVPEQLDETQLFNCIKVKIKSQNQFNRAFRRLNTLGLLIKHEPGNQSPKYSLHPIVRSYVRSEYASKQDRKPILEHIVGFFEAIIFGLQTDISDEVEYSRLRLWTEKADLEIEFGDWEKAVKTLAKVAPRLVASGHCEELFRVVRRVLADAENRPDFYADSNDFHELIRATIHAFFDFGDIESGSKYLEFYESVVNSNAARYVGFCSLSCFVYWQQADFETAIEWGKKGVEKKSKNNLDTGYDARSNLALALRDNGNPDEALELILSINNLTSLPKNLAEHEKKGGHFFGNIARCFMLKKQYPMALPYLKKSAQILENDSDSDSIKNTGYAAYWIAEVLKQEGDKELSAIFFRRAFNIWSKRAPALVERHFPKEREDFTTKEFETTAGMKEQEIDKICRKWIRS